MSLRLRLALSIAVAVAVGIGLHAVLLRAVPESPLRAAALALLLSLLPGLLLASIAAASTRQLLAVLAGLVRGLREGDFSLSLARARPGSERDALAVAFNALVDTLRRERRDIHQRELLLDTLVQAAPQALVLTGPDARIALGNAAARQLLAGGDRLEGRLWTEVLESAPTELREAILSGEDKLLTTHGHGEPEAFQLLHRAFQLNGQPHVLHLVQRLTRELTRQELATWKDLIRIISHELNNSLAPISSLAHSGRALVAQGRSDRLDEVFTTIQERATRLKHFLDGYASFAKLPRPRPEPVDWERFVRMLQGEQGFRIAAPLPSSPGGFDAGQMQQVLINLLKNAHESGSAAEAVELRIEADARGCQLTVLDRGTGMSEATLASALLPFYTTKQTGTGLGLALCREIVEAHRGRMGLVNREGGGLEVRVWLPAAAKTAGDAAGRPR